MIRRLICWATQHRWDIVSVNVRKNTNLFHLCAMAGCKAICERCDAEWDDLWSPYFGDDVIAYPSRRDRRALPVATALTRDDKS